jgi:hypothetical protein
MLKYADLFTPHHIAVLVDWLEEKDGFCVEIYFPHGGGSPSYFSVSSLAELKRLISDIRFPEVQITIWKDRKKEEFESDSYMPMDGELKWIYFHGDEVMYFSVQKNRNWSESYEKNPEKYRKEVEEWSK